MPLVDVDRDVWTFEDLLAIPEGIDWRRFEIVDGALVVSPSADRRHEVVIRAFKHLLDAHGDPDFMAYGPSAVDLDPSYLIPDIVVSTVTDAMRNTNPVPAHEILLAVEVVSRGSRSMDRFVKPQKFAEAGIPNYWRVETDPAIGLTAYRLDGAAYRELGTWGPGETAILAEPFPVTVVIDSIPRPV